MAVSPEIYLKKHSWVTSGRVIATGFGLLDGKLLTAAELAAAVNSEIIKSGRFEDLCLSVDGHFSVVVCNVGKTWIYAGNSWSFPLFYGTSGQNIVISDSPETVIQEMESSEISGEALHYFLTFGVTPGSSTLLENIKVIRPGESVSFDHSAGEISTRPFPVPDGSPVEVTTTQLAGILRKRFDVWSQIFKNKKVLLPLTGGWDSRLLACLLRESGHNNVVCATWGRPGNRDGAAAAITAQKLGFRHLFIPYSDQLTGDFPEERQFLEYASYTGHYTSMPFLQDFFAVRELLKNNEIDRETIVLPGHPGDFIRGAHHFKELPSAGPDEVFRQILLRFSTGLEMNSPLKRKIQSRIQEELFDPACSGRQNFDRWDYEERQCKLIANSCTVYSFFGLTFAMPLFDKELTGRMLTLPVSQRNNGRLYYDTLNNEFFRKYGIESGPLVLKEENSVSQLIKNKLIHLAPHWLKSLYYPVRDPIFYREITRKLMAFNPDMKFRHPEKPHLYNAYLTQWYAMWIGSRHKKNNLPDDL